MSVVQEWNEWADEEGNLGPVYGKQWRKWEAKDGRIIDQISEAIELIKTNPSSRRILVSAWNVGELDDMALMPCHAFFQFYVADGKLSCQLYQRSADVFLGVPFNIASYSMLTHLIAHHCGLEACEFNYHLGNCHIYDNHIETIKTQLNRKPYKFPVININRRANNIDEYTIEDFVLEDYNCHSKIVMEMRK